MAPGVAAVMAGLTKALGGQEDDAGTVLSWAARSAAGALGDVVQRLRTADAARAALLSAHAARAAVGSRGSARGDNGGVHGQDDGLGVDVDDSASQAPEQRDSDGDDANDDDAGNDDHGAFNALPSGDGVGGDAAVGDGLWESVSTAGGGAAARRPGPGSVASFRTGTTGRPRTVGFGRAALGTRGSTAPGGGTQQRVWTLHRSPLTHLDLSNTLAAFDDALKAVQLGMGELPPGGCMVAAGLDAVGAYLAHPQCSLARLNLSKNVLHPVAATGLLAGLAACPSLRSLSLAASRAPDGLLVPLVGKAVGFSPAQVRRILEDAALHPPLPPSTPAADAALPSGLVAYEPGALAASALSEPLLFETPGIVKLNLAGCAPGPAGLRTVSALLLAHERALAATRAGVAANAAAEAADAAAALSAAQQRGGALASPTPSAVLTQLLPPSERRRRFVRVEDEGLPEFVDVPLGGGGADGVATQRAGTAGSLGRLGTADAASRVGLATQPAGAGRLGSPAAASAPLYAGPRGSTPADAAGRRGSYSRTAELRLQLHAPDVEASAKTAADAGDGGGGNGDGAASTAGAPSEYEFVLRLPPVDAATVGGGLDSGSSSLDELLARLALEAAPPPLPPELAPVAAAATTTSRPFCVASGTSHERPPAGSRHQHIDSGGSSVSGGGRGGGTVVSVSKDATFRDAAAAMAGQLSALFTPPPPPLYDLRGDDAPTLRTLKLGGCRLDAAALPLLLRGVGGCSSLWALDLSGNPLGPEGCRQVATLLTRPRLALQRLSLASTGATRDGRDVAAVADLFAALDECNTSLAHLDLSRTVLLDHGALQAARGGGGGDGPAFARPADLHALVALISRVFARNTTLLSLDLRGDWLGPHAARLLAGGLRALPYGVPHAHEVADVLSAWVDAHMLRWRRKAAVGAVDGRFAPPPPPPPLLLRRFTTISSGTGSQPVSADVAADNRMNAAHDAVMDAAARGVGVVAAVAVFLAQTQPSWVSAATPENGRSPRAAPNGALTMDAAAGVAAASRGLRVEERVMHADDAAALRERRGSVGSRGSARSAGTGTRLQRPQSSSDSRHRSPSLPPRPSTAPASG